MKTGFGLTVVLLLATCGSAAAAQFQVTSGDMRDEGSLAQVHWFSGFGCTGGNVSPQLAWKNAPSGTRSFAVTAYDPDAPTGSGWWHWTVVNISSSVTSLAAGAGDKNSAKLPGGAVQGRNDFGYAGFGGACPPAGDKPHRYRFTVWALDTPALPIDAQASGALVGFMLHSHAIASAQLTARAGR
ncbi:YbhB/YbcL family Raf kinase inhibitor-like protein [Raoultella terrigena]|uniref:YbhB/YbcL family Raf kinase inhibitor-like protein n=1 Tax=Raoultella terrigena TaxID=577 RepID=UPI0030DDFE9C